MRVMVILAHPGPGSFNHAIAAAAIEALAEAGATPSLHDLYAAGFDPVRPSTGPDDGEEVSRQRREVSAADGIVVVHPVWFFAPPAILKGWVDRVMHELMAFRPRERGGLRARWALVLNTANAGSGRHEALGDPLDVFWRRCVFEPGGAGRFSRKLFAPLAGSSPEQRERWLAEARAAVRREALADGA